MAKYMIDEVRAADSRLRAAALAVSGAAIGILAWQLIGQSGVFGERLPALTTLIAGIFSPDGYGDTIAGAVVATLPRVAQGFFWGVLLGTAAGFVQLLLRRLSGSVHRLAALVNAIPIVVISPILVSLVGVQDLPVVIAVLSVFFTVFVALSGGFLNVPATLDDYFTASGAGRRKRLLHLELPSAVPSYVDGLRLAAMGALLSTMFGEWFGTSRGLGVLLMSSWQEFNMILLWSAALVATTLSIVFFLVMSAFASAVRRRVT